MTEINLTEAMTAAGHYPTDPMEVRWYARRNDIIGGWCVMPVDEPPSEGCYEVANFINKDEAEHIADLHNAWLDAPGEDTS